MRGKLHIILLLNGVMVLCACNQNQKAATSKTPMNQSNQKVYKSDVHNSSNSLDWAGTYLGILPCADCEGIKTELILNQDKTYSLKTSYTGKRDKTFEEKGTFSWNAAGNTITLAGITNKPCQYLVGENKMIQLDTKGNRITGNLAENYILKKQEQ